MLQTTTVFQNSLYVNLHLNTKFEKRTEAVWTACCQSQELCALCDMTSWLEGDRAENRAAFFFLDECLEFSHCEMSKKKDFWNVRNNIAASQCKSTFQADLYCKRTEQNKWLQSCHFSSFKYFPCFQRFYANPFHVNCLKVELHILQLWEKYLTEKWRRTMEYINVENKDWML